MKIMQSVNWNGARCVVLLLEVCILIAYFQTTVAGMFPLTLLKPEQQRNVPVLSLKNLGYIEYRPNGTLTLRSPLEKGSNLQNILLLKGFLNAIRIVPLPPGGDLTVTINGIKMYGEGVEHKLPPFFERILERIQRFFSVYRYTDTSKPLLQTQMATATGAAAATQTHTAKPVTTISTHSFTTSTIAGIDNKLETTTFVDTQPQIADDDDNEFVSIGENDGFISVGED